MAASDAVSTTQLPDSPAGAEAEVSTKSTSAAADVPASSAKAKHSRFSFISVFPLAFFLSTWMGSVFCFPLAALLSFGWNFHFFSIALLVYYTYRIFFKLHPWDYVVGHGRAEHGIQRDVTAKYPFFRTQQAVLECGPIKPNSKALLSWHPHGILCLGWILNGNVGSELFGSAFRWLTAGVLFKLPFLAEMLTW
eukprot:scaffold469115_cov47-Prasinocladus_malaysianus.AAC.1